MCTAAIGTNYMVKKTAVPAASKASKVKSAAPSAAKPAATVKAARRPRVAKPAPIVEPVAAAIGQPIEAEEVIETFAAKNGISGTSEIEEGTSEMKTQTNDAVVDRVQAIFGDVNERARTAFEKNAKIVEEFTELTRGNVEALVASSKVAARGVEALSQEAA
jgi:hypothetical protein